MSIAVQLTMGTFPNGYCFTNPQSYANDLVALITAIVPGSLNTFVVGNNVPQPADQNKPWIRLNSDGTLDGVYIYLGQWLRPHPVPASSPTYWIYNGSESSVWAWDGGDGNNPSITPPTDTTGAMWQVEHGFDFLIPMGAGTNSVPYGGVFTTLAVNGTAGEERHVLDITEIPSHSHQMLARNDIGTGAGVTCASLVSNTTNLNDVAVGGGLSHQNLPPVKGVYFIKRTARRFYTV